MRLLTAAGASLMLLSACTAEAQKPDAEQFKAVFDQQQQKLKTPGFTQRTVLFENVTPGKRSGGTSTFLVTATVHDYGPGYPANRYFGQTCVGRMEKWPFEMKKNDFGEWIVQGRMTISDRECKDNPAEGVSATPVEGLPGRRAKQPTPGGDRKSTAKAQAPAAVPLGEYACYGVGSRLMAGAV